MINEEQAYLKFLNISPANNNPNDVDMAYIKYLQEFKDEIEENIQVLNHSNCNLSVASYSTQIEIEGISSSSLSLHRGSTEIDLNHIYPESKPMLTRSYSDDQMSTISEVRDVADIVFLKTEDGTGYDYILLKLTDQESLNFLLKEKIVLDYKFKYFINS